MASYDLIERLTDTFRQLEHGLLQLKDQLNSTHLLAARVFRLPEITKGHEHDPLTTIDVTQLTGQQAHQAALYHFTHLFIQQQSENRSSKVAVRLPGALCYDVNATQQQQITALIGQINQLKTDFEKLVTRESALPPAQRFEWVHQHLPGLLTLNTYRNLVLLENPLTLNFGWANKHIIKNLTRQDVLTLLEKGINNPRTIPAHRREKWVEQLNQEYGTVAALQEIARRKITRPVKVQPVARAWYPQQQRQVQYACPSPLLVLCRRDQGISVPELGELLNYDADNIQHRYRPQAQPLELVIPRLHLWLAS